MTKLILSALMLSLASASLATDWGHIRTRCKDPKINLNAQSGYNCEEKTGVKPAAPSLKDQLKGAKVEETKDGLKVTFASGLLFGTDSSEINPAGQSEIHKIAEYLKKKPSSTIRVEGHTDNTGEDAYNKDLSVKRAEAVASSLETKGVSKSRVQFLGYGEERPVASNDTKDGRQANRRVEIFIRN